jgi:hypothetical protein
VVVGDVQSAVHCGAALAARRAGRRPAGAGRFGLRCGWRRTRGCVSGWGGICGPDRNGAPAAGGVPGAGMPARPTPGPDLLRERPKLAAAGSPRRRRLAGRFTCATYGEPCCDLRCLTTQTRLEIQYDPARKPTSTLGGQAPRARVRCSWWTRCAQRHGQGPEDPAGRFLSWPRSSASGTRGGTVAGEGGAGIMLLRCLPLSRRCAGGDCSGTRTCRARPTLQGHIVASGLRGR